jgi:hypothetical protein
MTAYFNWKKSPAALFRTLASLPPVKGATFAGSFDAYIGTITAVTA